MRNSCFVGTWHCAELGSVVPGFGSVVQNPTEEPVREANPRKPRKPSEIQGVPRCSAFFFAEFGAEFRAWLCGIKEVPGWCFGSAREICTGKGWDIVRRFFSHDADLDHRRRFCAGSPLMQSLIQISLLRFKGLILHSPPYIVSSRSHLAWPPGVYP